MSVRPPAHIALFVDALGEEGAISFFMTFGGAELYIARSVTGRGMVERELGEDTALRLAELAERAILPRRIPMPKPWLAQVFRSRGLPVAEISRRLHASDVAVRRWLSAAPADAAPSTDTRQPRFL